MDSLVNDDLGVTGDDGIELMVAFSEEFKVDMSQCNVDYFGPESSASIIGILLYTYYLFQRPRRNYSSGLPPLPVSNFIDSAAVGKWSGM